MVLAQQDEELQCPLVSTFKYSFARLTKYPGAKKFCLVWFAYFAKKIAASSPIFIELI